jgi:phosphoglycolate phosphatase
MAIKHIPGDFRLIVFDLDGTLIDSKEDLALSVNLMRGEMGLAPLEYELIASYVGQGVGVLVRRALGNGKPETVPDADVERGVEIFLRTYRLHMLDHTVPYDGVREALAVLTDRRSPESAESPEPGKLTVPRSLAVLTNKPVNFSRAILVGLGIASYFAFVYGGNSPELNQQKKPDPAGVFKLMGDTGATADQTLMVGDSDTDVLTGRNAGVWTCGVTYGIGSHTLATTPPDVLLGDLRELPPLLGLGNRNGKSI